MSYVNTSVDADILSEFRNVISSKRDLKKDWVSKTLEDAIREYIVKHKGNSGQL